MAGTVQVDRQTIFVRNQRMETAPKTEAGIRTVHLPAVVVEALAEQLDRYAQDGPDGFVFTGDKGGELSTASIYPAFDAAKKAIGLEKVTIHDLRHAAGTLAARTGATTRS